MTRDICSTRCLNDASAKASNVISLDEYRARKYGDSADREDVLKESLLNAAAVCREIATEIRSERQARLDTLRTIETNLDALLEKY